LELSLWYLWLPFANQGSEVNPGPAPEPGVTPNPTEPAKVVDIRIDTSAERKPISPYIYGSNQELDATVTAKRFGGNRTTGYNWENNFSNAGSDWLHYSDTYLLEDGGVPKGEWSTPASVVTTFHDKALSKNVPYTLITLQAAGYVSADGTDRFPRKKLHRLQDGRKLSLKGSTFLTYTGHRR